MPDEKNIRQSRAPVPPWVIGVPLIGAVLATIMFAGGHRGFLSIVLFIVGVAVFMYLYVYMIRIWLRWREKRSLK
jgi:hypothetical protein